MFLFLNIKSAGLDLVNSKFIQLLRLKYSGFDVLMFLPCSLADIYIPQLHLYSFLIVISLAVS